MRPILYISGPYSPLPGRTTEDNIALARRYAVEAWRKGWAAFCPHLNTAGFEHDCPEIDHSAWIDGDLSILSGLNRERGDAVLMIGEWWDSRGSCTEERIAEDMGLNIHYLGVSDTPIPEAPR